MTTSSNVGEDQVPEMTELKMEELKERLDEAVESGALTQEQAEVIRAAAENWEDGTETAS